MCPQAKKERLSPELAQRLAALYRRMEDAYDLVARQLDFSCRDCPSNCCDSYFLHHTRIEWAYLRQGLEQLSPEHQGLIRERALAWREREAEALAENRHPEAMCPLNEEGLCVLYQHRLMICRLHGVPSSITLPNGRSQKFPGCFRCQELTADRAAAPAVERASLLRELVMLEQLMPSGPTPPGVSRVKIRKSIAEMILEEL